TQRLPLRRRARRRGRGGAPPPGGQPRAAGGRDALASHGLRPRSPAPRGGGRGRPPRVVGRPLRRARRAEAGALHPGAEGAARRQGHPRDRREPRHARGAGAARAALRAAHRRRMAVAPRPGAAAARAALPGGGSRLLPDRLGRAAQGKAMKPRILFLTTELPWPTDGGGKLRTAETLACLLHFAEVRVLSVSEASDASADARALQRALPGLGVEPPIPHPVRIRRRPLFLVRTAAVQLLRREPYLTAKFASATYQRRARSLVASFAPDLIWCDHLNVFPAARRVAREAGLPLVLDQHNVESDLFVRAAGAGRLAPLARWEGARLRRYEVAALCAADAVGAIRREDAARFAEMSGREAVTILPSMGELGEAPAPPPPSHRVAFLGTLSWPPNAEGVDWLAREVAQRAPELRFVVGGRGLAPAIAR